TLPAPRLMVLGDMGEVGDQGPQFHAQAGMQAHALGIEALLTLGPLSVHASDGFPGAQHCDTMAALIDAVRARMPTVASVLVKGSRFMAMERVVTALIDDASQGQAAATGETACC
ncbi:MAG: UDP-N-acetylmuramoylalanyl-D-glutamyl-2, 6-diaminopimelate--D-alanyl-D-alanine ligase, partial [Burkholderiaceae bacterium]